MAMNGEAFFKLSADLNREGSSIGKRAQQVVRKSGKDIEANAKQIVPVDTGNLKGSISTTDLRSVGTSGTISVGVGASADYAFYVEYGTSRMAPQAFLGPSFDRVVPGYVKAMGQLGFEEVV